VIGGGDVNPERLLPDLIAAYGAGSRPALRYPAAVRPWQHVLDCLGGYLTLVDALLAGDGQGAWNFGPSAGELVTVEGVAAMVAAAFGVAPAFEVVPDQPPEAGLLVLDSTRARTALGWRSRLTLAEAVEWSVGWGRATDPRSVSLGQVREYLARG
jgi:CDP-glucose 4,6-dehydratase